MNNDLDLLLIYILISLGLDIETYPLTELKIENLRLRDLRRNFRTRLGKMGFSDDLTQRLLGHEQRQMTYHYAEANIEVVKQAKKLLDKNLKA